MQKGHYFPIFSFLVSRTLAINVELKKKKKQKKKPFKTLRDIMTQNKSKTKIDIPWNRGYLRCKLNLLVEDEIPQNAILIQVNIKALKFLTSTRKTQNPKRVLKGSAVKCLWAVTKIDEKKQKGVGKKKNG